MNGPEADSGSGRHTASGELCLVTGATGFIGAHIARRLLQDGYRVRCLVRASSDTSALTSLDAELASGDLTSPGSVASAADGCRFVVHCAALVSDWATVDEIKEINVIGTRNVLTASVAASVERLVHLSTTDVYGYPGGSEIDESHAPHRFSNWYSATKLAAEREVIRAGKEHPLEVVILRPATVYGPRSEDVVGAMARAIQAGWMLMVGGGRAVAGLSYVENLVDAACIALRHQAAPGQAFNVTDGLDIAWRRFLGDLAEGLNRPPPRWSLPYGVAYGVAFVLEHGYRLLRRTTGVTSSPLLSRQAIQVLGRDQHFSNHKLRRLLGWEPRFSYAAGLDATLVWLREWLG